MSKTFRAELTDEQYEELVKMGVMHQFTDEELDCESLRELLNKSIMERLEGAVGELIRNSRVVVDEENGEIICDKLFPPYDKTII